MKPYTYLIGWPDHNKWYYGVRYSKNCHPDDLWVTYFTSSGIVKDFVKEYGDPTHLEIRKLFNDKAEARLWENRVLTRLKVVTKDDWLNKNDSMAPPINPLGNIAMRRPELREKASENNSGSKNPMFGRKQKRKVCEHCEEEVAANVYSLYHGDNCEVINPEAKNKAKLRNSGPSNGNYGKKKSKVSCLACEKVVDVTNFVRYHGNNCKNSLTNLVVARTETC